MANAKDAYLGLLRKARSSLPENVANRERWGLPDPDVIVEGRMSILRNFRDILGATRRDEAHLAKYLLSQIGTAGHVDGDRLVFTGKVPPQKISDRLEEYVGTFVRCSECGAPDTHLEKDGRVPLLKCEACGAHKPIKVRKARKQEAAVREGATIEVTPNEQGQRGEVKARVEGYTLIVPGGRTGQSCWVRINKIAGKIVFTEIVPEPKE